jgi:hypothetical protein
VREVLRDEYIAGVLAVDRQIAASAPIIADYRSGSARPTRAIDDLQVAVAAQLDHLASLRLEAGGALGKDQRVRSGKIGRKRFAGGHTTMESHPSPSASQKHHPTDVGRHVSCGCLQSMPDRR